MEREREKSIIDRAYIVSTTGEDRYSTMAGIELEELDFDYCKMSITVEEKHKNPMGTVHGGCLYTLADSCAGAAAFTTGVMCPTISGDMYFVRSTLGIKKLICEGRVIKAGSRVIVCEAVIYGDGKEVARATLQYAVM